MEEKKQMKISLSGLFLIIAIIAIVIMGFFIFKLSKEKANESAKVTDLNKQISNLENNINLLQNKMDNISNIVNSNTSSNESNANMTESNAKKLVEEKLKLTLELMSLKGDFKIEKDEINNLYPVVNYEEVCNKYMTPSFEKYFRNEIWNQYQWKDGQLYMLPAGGVNHEIAKIEFIDIKVDKDKISSTLKTDIIATDVEGQDKRNYNCDFEIINENDSWKINKCVLTPNGEWTPVE